MMTKHISIATMTLLATTLGATFAFGQTSNTPAPQQAPSPHHGMMMGQTDKDHGGMIDMTQMNRMMENCNRMMEGMQHAAPNNG